MALKDLNLRDYFDDGSEYGVRNILNDQELKSVYGQVSSSVEGMEEAEPFMSDFVANAYGVDDPTSTVFLLKNYEKVNSETSDLVELFGLMTTDGNLQSFYDSLTAEDKKLNPLDVFANFALLTEEATKEEIAEEYIGIMHKAEQDAFVLLQAKGFQLTK